MFDLASDQLLKQQDNPNKRCVFAIVVTFSATLSEGRALGGAFLHTLLDPQNQMNEPVDLNHPALLPADLYLVQQVALRLLLAAADRQRLPDVLDVLLARQLRHA